MQIVNVQQGTPEWHELRLTKFTASEAPAMMGASKYMSRDELLKLKSTGLVKEATSFQQSIFDKGHEAERLARPIVEKIINDELFPATGISDTESQLLASFDGVTMMEDIIYEHKLWNEQLARDVEQKNLDPHYYWQLEQQLLVSNAKKAIFVVSDGSEDKFRYMEYEPVPERRITLIDGWKQFAEDLKKYEAPEVTAPVQGKAIMQLPALLVELEGVVKTSNLPAYESKALEFIRSINTNLVTDQDFADAEATVKFCESAEKDLDIIKKQALSKTEQIDLLFRTIDHLREELRNKRLEISKLVKTRKDAIREKILTEARNSLNDYISGLNAELELVRLPVIQADFAGVMKGKKTLTSLQSAVNDELAKAKIAANGLYEKITVNLNAFTNIEPQFKALFADLNSIVTNDPEHFALLLEQRINQFKVTEDERTKQLEELRIKQASIKPVVIDEAASPVVASSIPVKSASITTAINANESIYLLTKSELSKLAINLEVEQIKALFDALHNNQLTHLTYR